MKLLIGGSPCTYWSIAQTKARETKAEGLGWELFKNYLIARDKYQPDYFLYENNKSMAAAIRAQITEELGVEPVLINSALVSAQSRQRLYWVGRRDPITGRWEQVHIEQPEDRGILLRDILESGVCWREKAYTLRASAGAHQGQGNIVRGITSNGKFSYTGVAEPVRIGTIESDAKNADFDSQQYRVYSPDGKSVTLCGQGGGVGAKTGLYATPICVNSKSGRGGVPGLQPSLADRIYSIEGKGTAVTTAYHPNIAVPVGMAWRGRGDSSAFEVRNDEKSNSVTAAGHQSRLVIEDAAMYQVPRGFNKGGIKYDKAPTLTANGDWQHNNFVIEAADGKTHPVYEVRDGQITIKGKQYPVKLADGFYIIRKQTVTECKRLQTVPESYVFPVSDTQAYKMLGNGWTVDVIAHIMSHFEGLTAEPVEVLSMYDGMSCGHLALDKLGVEVLAYYATEIDKYAIQTTQHNFPDTVQMGDAFQVRDAAWNCDGIITL